MFKRWLSDSLYKLDMFHFIEVNPPQEGHGFPFYRGPCSAGCTPAFYPYKIGTHDAPTEFTRGCSIRVYIYIHTYIMYICTSICNCIYYTYIHLTSNKNGEMMGLGGSVHA